MVGSADWKIYTSCYVIHLRSRNPRSRAGFDSIKLYSNQCTLWPSKQILKLASYLSEGEKVDCGYLSLEIRMVRLEMYPEVRPNRADDIDITVVYINSGNRSYEFRLYLQG